MAVKLTQWQYRFLKALGIMKADDALAGLSKHGRGKQASPYAEERRRWRRKMAAASQKAQRPRHSKARGYGRRNRFSSHSWR